MKDYQIAILNTETAQTRIITMTQRNISKYAYIRKRLIDININPYLYVIYKTKIYTFTNFVEWVEMYPDIEWMEISINDKFYESQHDNKKGLENNRTYILNKLQRVKRETVVTKIKFMVNELENFIKNL